MLSKGGTGVLFTHQSPARSTQKPVLLTGLRGCFQKEGTCIMRIPYHTEWGGGVGGVDDGTST